MFFSWGTSHVFLLGDKSCFSPGGHMKANIQSFLLFSPQERNIFFCERYERLIEQRHRLFEQQDQLFEQQKRLAELQKRLEEERKRILAR